MSGRIECFWMEPAEAVRVSLRRYQGNAACPLPWSYHNASIVIGDEPAPLDPQGMLGHGRDDHPHEDPRWPATCLCGYAFKAGDEWQCNVDRLFKGPPDGRLYTTRDMPPGAMYDATWWNVPGPDGVTLTVVLPPNGGDDVWHPDSPSSNSNTPWTRTGEIPRVTCTPSILTPRYHGFLTDGWLIEC